MLDSLSYFQLQDNYYKLELSTISQTKSILTSFEKSPLAKVITVMSPTREKINRP